MADASSLKGTLLGAAIFGGIIFAAIFAVLFGITGIVIFGFSGVFGILAGAVMGLVIGAGLGILFLIITTEPSSKSQKAIRTITFAGIFVGRTWRDDNRWDCWSRFRFYLLSSCT